MFLRMLLWILLTVHLGHKNQFFIKHDGNPSMKFIKGTESIVNDNNQELESKVD